MHCPILISQFFKKKFLSILQNIMTANVSNYKLLRTFLLHKGMSKVQTQYSQITDIHNSSVQGTSISQHTVNLPIP